MALQKFTPEYLERCRELTPDQILQFLEDFRALHGTPRSPSRLISLKVPQDLLDAFRAKAGLIGTPYQTQIKRLMKDWLIQSSD